MKDLKQSQRKYQASFLVLNQKGLHTRPSTEIVKCATQYKSKIHLTCQGITVDAKSLLGILMLAATYGAQIQVEAEGNDAIDAVKALIELASHKFNIQY